MKMLTWLSKRRFPYEPLISVEISRSRLIGNLAAFQRLAPKNSEYPMGAVAPVLKSNAYGHGLFEVASILEKNAVVPFFVVDSYFEAIALRTRGIRTPLLVIGYTRPEIIAASRLKNVAFTVTSLDTLKSLRGKKATIHVKIDTGMRRQGVLVDEIDEALQLIAESPHITLDGICSHLCDADDADPSFTRQQIAMWNILVRKIQAAFPLLRYIHLSNTDGHRFSGEIEANVSRLGIGLYGLLDNNIFTATLHLEPVLQMKTIITGVKPLKQKETVGYSNTYIAQHDMTIATVPVGYFEGIDRRLSSAAADHTRGVILVGPGHIACPIIGRISMNITSIDISKIPHVTIGTPVIAISNKSSDENSIVSIAKKCNAISYEIVVHIPAHLRRTIVD
ncbi:MAG: alanine racemase [bacterium]